MICVKLLPRIITRCLDVNKESLTINEILNELRDYLESEEIMVVVNGRIIGDYNTTVTEKDDVIIVQAFMGG